MTEFVHVVGARPNFVKAAPVVEAMAEEGVKQVLIHTGQHYDKGLSHVFFEELGLPEPDTNLGVGSGSHAEQTARLLTALEEAFQELRPAWVVVYGDVNSTLAGALVASKLEIPTAHVEAGLRSFDRSMPEEINRVVTDALASLHLVTSAEGMAHLAREGLSPEGMHLVGNPMIDTLLRLRERLDPDPVLGRLDIEGDFGVVTVHRPHNVDRTSAAERVVKGLKGVADLLPLVIPLHPRGRRTLEEAGLDSDSRIRVVDPLGYLDFMAMMSVARLVLTDSGGIQEETTVLGIPCLTLRPNTERPVTVTHGTNLLVGSDPDLMVKAAAEALDRHWEPRFPPLWDGRAGERIASVLINAFRSESE